MEGLFTLPGNTGNVFQEILRHYFKVGAFCIKSVLLEKTLEIPLDCKEIQQVHSEGDQPWDFFGRNDAKAETPVLWPSPAKS